jgi:hypothetical protein
LLHVHLIAVSSANKIALEVIDVTFHIHQILFFFVSINLNTTKAFSCEVIRVINIDYIIFFNLLILLIEIIFELLEILILLSHGCLDIFFFSIFLTG